MSKITQETRESILEQVKSLYENGYACFDLIKMGYFTKEDILEVQETCMESYYKYFTDRGIARADVEIDLTKKNGNESIFQTTKRFPNVQSNVWGYFKSRK